MAINLGRAEQIGEENETTPKTSTSDNGLSFSQIEVLTINKVPFVGVPSEGKDGFYQCPFCRKNTIKQIIDYRCHKCESKVIFWKCCATHKEERHQQYDTYIARFYEATAAKVAMMKAQYEKEGKKWPDSSNSKPVNLHPN